MNNETRGFSIQNAARNVFNCQSCELGWWYIFVLYILVFYFVNTVYIFVYFIGHNQIRGAFVVWVATHLFNGGAHVSPDHC